MVNEILMRRTLIFSVFFNFGGAMLFLFPNSLGQLVGLPVPVPFLYSGFCALVILTFGGAYAWLSRCEIINRPVVVLSAIGKAGFFVVVLVSWLIGETAFQFVASATGDLIMAGIFTSWLVNSGRNMQSV